MVSQYVNFGYPDTMVAPLVGFDLEDSSPVTGEVSRIIIDSPSEFLGIRCRINEIMILPLEGEITIRTAVSYPIGRKVNARDRLVVELENHDPINVHTPSIVWEVEEEKPPPVSEELKKEVIKA